MKENAPKGVSLVCTGLRATAKGLSVLRVGDVDPFVWGAPKVNTGCVYASIRMRAKAKSGKATHSSVIAKCSLFFRYPGVSESLTIDFWIR